MGAGGEAGSKQPMRVKAQRQPPLGLTGVTKCEVDYDSELGLRRGWQWMRRRVSVPPSIRSLSHPQVVRVGRLRG